MKSNGRATTTSESPSAANFRDATVNAVDDLVTDARFFIDERDENVKIISAEFSCTFLASIAQQEFFSLLLQKAAVRKNMGKRDLRFSFRYN
jgi:hypothetical protein